ncbi:MAG: DEAD/DEAH box helicase [Gammaproteobacteria bacterium]|nr:DEAD/DEAH box helicase [Gammaproteobacteria bacterium]
MQQDLVTNTPFTDLPLLPVLIEGLSRVGFTHCTPIQAAALPLALAGRDVAGQAQTGTGKTAAFLLAIMQHLLSRPADERRRPNDPRAIVLAPTRELAIQIHKDALSLGGHTELKFALVYGGVDYDKQRDAIADGVDVLIGTPGRIIDYFKQRIFDLKSIEVLVLDEADRMFDLGFIKDIRFLLRRMPKATERLNMLFSATLSLRVHELAYEHMNNAEAIEIEPDKVTVDKVTQLLYHVESREKFPLLIGVLQREAPTRTLIFVNTRRGAEQVEAVLCGNGFEAARLTGDVLQKKRQKLIHQFATGELPILVATDVAARGLHIPGVSHVINFDLPQNAEDYVHRIGRTARAGETGDAISFACEQFVFSLAEIEELIGHRIPTLSLSDEMLVKPAPAARIERDDRVPRRRDGGGPGDGRGGGRRRPGRRSPRSEPTI